MYFKLCLTELLLYTGQYIGQQILSSSSKESCRWDVSYLKMSSFYQSCYWVTVQESRSVKTLKWMPWMKCRLSVIGSLLVICNTNWSIMIDTVSILWLYTQLWVLYTSSLTLFTIINSLHSHSNQWPFIQYISNSVCMTVVKSNRKSALVFSSQ